MKINIDKYKKYSSEKLHSSLIAACRNGDLEKVTILLESPEFSMKLSVDHGEKYSVLSLSLHAACCNGKLKIVKYLLEKYTDKIYPEDIIYALRGGFTQFTKSVNVIKYLVMFNNKHQYFEISNIFQSLFRNAFTYGQPKAIEFLLHSKLLKINPDISDFPQAASLACTNKDIETLKFLLESDKLKKHANIHDKSDSAFKICCDENKEDFLKYLIFDYKINKTTEIENYLNNVRNDGTNKAVKFFNLRELNERMNNELNDSNTHETKRNKI